MLMYMCGLTGGHVRHKVMVVLYPRVLTTVGNCLRNVSHRDTAVYE
jgi:hypothetical protein